MTTYSDTGLAPEALPYRSVPLIPAGFDPAKDSYEIRAFGGGEGAILRVVEAHLGKQAAQSLIPIHSFNQCCDSATAMLASAGIRLVVRGWY
jgi:hypothetical protein